MSKLLSVREAAEILNLHPISLYRLIDRGAIPAVRIGGRSIRFDPGALEAFIQAGGSARQEAARA